MDEGVVASYNVINALIYFSWDNDTIEAKLDDEDLHKSGHIYP